MRLKEYFKSYKDIKKYSLQDFIVRSLNNEKPRGLDINNLKDLWKNKNGQRGVELYLCALLFHEEVEIKQSLSEGWNISYYVLKKHCQRKNINFEPLKVHYDNAEEWTCWCSAHIRSSRLNPFKFSQKWKTLGIPIKCFSLQDKYHISNFILWNIYKDYADKKFEASGSEAISIQCSFDHWKLLINDVSKLKKSKKMVDR